MSKMSEQKEANVVIAGLQEAERIETKLGIVKEELEAAEASEQAAIQRAEQAEARLAECEREASDYQRWLEEANGQLASQCADSRNLQQQLAQANEQLAGEAAKCEAMRKAEEMCPRCKGKKGFEDTTYDRTGVWTACGHCKGHGTILNDKVIRATLALTPHAALQRYGLEVSERACKEAVLKCFGKGEVGRNAAEGVWMNSQTRASLAGKEEA